MDEPSINSGRGQEEEEVFRLQGGSVAQKREKATKNDLQG